MFLDPGLLDATSWVNVYVLFALLCACKYNHMKSISYDLNGGIVHSASDFTLIRLYNPKFRFRENEIARILYCWSQGQSVLLTGIRRTGKSEVLRAALYRYAQNGNKVGNLDVQDQNSLPRFYQQLLETLLREAPVSFGDKLVEAMGAVTRVPNSLMNWVRGQINKVSVPELLDIELAPPDELLMRYWQPLAEQITSVLAKHEPQTLPVIGIDELPLMLENLLREGIEPNEITIMLASLRKMRDAGLRLIIAGSISFENLLTLRNVPHTVLGGLSRQSIPPFTREEAANFLRESLAERPACEETVLALTLDTLPDYVPEFLRIAKNYLYVCRDTRGCELALQQDILPEIRRSFLQQFDERLAKNYGSDELKTAERILDIVAQDDIGGSRIDGSQLPADYRKVLLKLEYDNFLIEGEDFKWRITLNLIRQWWRANRGMA